MRESFGGTMMLTIMMIFIVLFVTFVALVLNVAKTFRIKNQVVNIIEQSSTYDEVTKNVENYIVPDDNENNRIYSYTGKKKCEGGSYVEGVCIVPKCNGGGTCSTSNASYYSVTVYSCVELPLFGLSFEIPISGETTSKIVIG